MSIEQAVDFFISYTSSDRAWAEWIAWCLEQAKYSVIIQAWDFPASSNFVHNMDEALKRAERVVAVLSPAYLQSSFAKSEWIEAYRRDPLGEQGLLLPMRIAPCDLRGLLGAIVYTDLVECDEPTARARVLSAAKGKQPHPSHVAFPSPDQASTRPRFPGAFPPMWNIPFPRNPYFIGREQLLSELAKALRLGQPAILSQPPKDVQPQAISGLGGIGKTQVALEYAYRYRGEYQAVLWVQAETNESLTSSYLQLAALLDLPEKDAQESALIVAAVKRWLQRATDYLLILDNADDLKLAWDFLPPSHGGHILLTTRAQASGRMARLLEVETLPQEQAVELLLRRAGILTETTAMEQISRDVQKAANPLCEELGCLPLAIDQAGAYIEETRCGVVKYLQRYRRQRNKLLAERRGIVNDHPLPVATTWQLSFEKVEQKSTDAADLLRLCAFLAPDAIPEFLFLSETESDEPAEDTQANEDLLDEAIEALLAYSLVKRDVTTQTFSVHRLVQAVMRDRLSEEEQRKLAEQAVFLVFDKFPEPQYKTWPLCEQLLSHTLVCSSLINAFHLDYTATAQLLNNTALYMADRARYEEAEGLYQQALTIWKQELGPSHPYTATSLNNLAALYYQQGKYEEAEPLYQQALAISEQELGPLHPGTATSLNNLAMLYCELGKYEEAELLLHRTLTINEQELGPLHPNTAQALNNLGLLYYKQGKYEQAESLLQRALAIKEQELGAVHPDTALSLNNLAEVYRTQGKYEQAVLLAQQALAIREQVLGPVHPDTAQSLNNLAEVYRTQGKYEQAEPLLQRALTIWGQMLDPLHPYIAQGLNNLGLVYQQQGKYEQAEPLLQRALTIREQVLGPLHPDTALGLNNLAELYYQQGKYEQAEPLLQRALAICEQVLGPEHPTTCLIRANYNIFLSEQKLQEE